MFSDEIFINDGFALHVENTDHTFKLAEMTDMSYIRI